jgi:hypothetical protein
MKTRQLIFALTMSFAAHVLFAAQTKTVNVTGTWQISWEARVGTERDTLELQQTEAKLTGSFEGKVASPKVSGSVDGQNISLRLDFAGPKPYTIVFTGTLDGEKMSGKFEIPGVAGAYDWHGENVRSTNYTWSAVRIPDAPQTGGTAVNGAPPSQPGPVASRSGNRSKNAQ